MNVTLVRGQSGFLHGATSEDCEKLKAWKPGQAARVRINKPRNYKHHAKFMACVAFVAQRHKTFRRFRNNEPLLHFLKDETGHYYTYAKPGGEVIKVMRSISFDEMDEGDFIAWSAEAKKILAQLILDFVQWPDSEAGAWLDWCMEGASE